MATTSIWSVKGWLGKLVIYVENPDKTENPAYFEKTEMDESGRQALEDVLDYAMRESAVSWDMPLPPSSKSKPLEKAYFVSGINCAPSTARDEMLAVQRRFGKTKGIVAFHGYQSFAPGEGTPEQVHEIGIKLAERLWGDRFQVIVTTHLDHANHLHNHFVVNAVSFLDGKRFHRDAAEYHRMREESDKLCREYGLSIIENPQPGKAMQRGEWEAAKAGKSTYRGEVRRDVDDAIQRAVSDRQFFYFLREKGYEVKIGKDITVKPPGRDRGLKLERNFGSEYSYDSICRRIREETPDYIPPLPVPLAIKTVPLRGKITRQNRRGGLRGLYYYFSFRLGIIGRKRDSNTNLPFQLRAELRKMERYSREARLLAQYRIDTPEHLVSLSYRQTQKIEALSEQRKDLRNLLRRESCAEPERVRQQIAELSQEIGRLRDTVNLCGDIAYRSGVMMETLEELRNGPGKEKQIEPRRGRGGASHSDQSGRS